MPDTPNFAITYPCMGVPIVVADFNTYANDVETAIATVSAEAVAVAGVPYAFAATQSNPAFGVETIMTTSSISSSGITPGVGTFTIVTPGMYTIGAQLGAASSTLTITSQRLAIYVNGTIQASCKWRGSNPSDAFVQNGAYTIDLPLAVADLITFRYLWTGTGALGGPVSGVVSLTLLSTP